MRCKNENYIDCKSVEGTIDAAVVTCNVIRAFLIIYLQTLRKLEHGFIRSRAWRSQVQFQFARRSGIYASIPLRNSYARVRSRGIAFDGARARAHKSLCERLGEE